MSNKSAWVSIVGVAKRIGVSKSTIRRWMEDGKFPSPVYFSPRVMRWDEAEIDAYLDKQKASRF